METKVGAYSPETAKMVLKTVEAMRAQGLVLQSGNKQPFNPPRSLPIYVRNDSGVTIPPFGCVQVSGTVEYGGQNFVKVIRPTDPTGASGGFLFNTFDSIANGKYGICCDGPVSRSLCATSPAVGSTLRPDAGTFYLEEHASGTFTYIGPDDIYADCTKTLRDPTAPAAQPPIPFMRWIATANIADRSFAASVDWVEGEVTNPLTTNPYMRGDTLTIYDPANLFADIVIDSVGTAYYRKENSSESTPDADEVTSARWEVHTADQPVNEIEVTIRERLISGELIGTARVNETFSIRSSYPNVADLTTGEYDHEEDGVVITFNNKWGLDCPPETKGILRRITDKWRAYPYNLQTPKDGSATQYVWELVQVETPIARWISGTIITGGIIGIDDYWDGGNPSEGRTDNFVPEQPLKYPCPLEGKKVVCCYRVQDDEYVIVNADLESDDELIVTAVSEGDTCGFEIQTKTVKVIKCGETTTTFEEVFLPTIEAQVVYDITASPSGLFWNYATIQVCDFTTGGGGQLPFIACEPTCTGTAEWVWDGSEWIPDGDSCSVDCVAPPAPTTPPTPDEIAEQGEYPSRSLPCIPSDA